MMRTYLEMEIAPVLHRHKITSASQLDRRLTAPAPKPDPMEGRALVVDSKNPDRILGSIERPRGASPKLDGGDCWNVMVPQPVTAGPMEPYEYMAMPSPLVVRFGFRCADWKVVLSTDAKLDLLLKIEHFRLPGETAEQAHVRSMYR
jgi:hypothetical protein